MVFTMAATASAQGTRMNVMSGASFLTNKDVTPAQPTLELPTKLTFETDAVTAAFAPKRASGDPHTAAIGVTSGGYAFGFGLLFRYWTSEKMFIDATLAHYGYGFGGVTSF